MSYLLKRELSKPYRTVGKGQFPYFLQSDTYKGHVYIDLSGGAAVSALGHGNAYVTAKMTEYLKEYSPYVYSGFAVSDAAEFLAERLVFMLNSYPDWGNPDWGNWFSGVLFTMTGSEAVEAACRIASVVSKGRGRQSKKFAARASSYHGTNTFTLALSDPRPSWSEVDDSFVVRLPAHHTSEAFSLQDRESVWQNIISGVPWSAITAVVVEPVATTPSGVSIPNSTYLEHIRDCAASAGALTIFDEVLCGAGRCGYLSAAQMLGVRPDILILGKGLASGYMPLSAVCISTSVFAALSQFGGVLPHGGTYSQLPLSCATANAVLDVMQQEALFSLVKARSSEWRSLIAFQMKKTRCHTEVTGAGALFCIRLYTPDGKYFASRFRFADKVRERCASRGVSIYTKSGTVYGCGDFILVAPAFTMPFEIAEVALQIVCECCEATLAEYLLR